MEWINKQNVLIVGLGLMGGSYAKALKRIGCRVTAIDRSEDTIRFAVENNIINEGTWKNEEVAKFVKEADCIILALYPNAAIDWVKENVGNIKEGIRITDVTGVKSCIVYEIQDILGDKAEFIAAHPMAVDVKKPPLFAAATAKSTGPRSGQSAISRVALSSRSFSK